MAQRMDREIEGYSVWYYGGGTRLTDPYFHFRAIITLYVGQGFLVGLYFHSDPSTMPEGDYLPDSGQAFVHFPTEDFPQILDLLRNEKPVYYHQVPDAWPKIGFISTTQEPTGEGEEMVLNALRYRPREVDIARNQRETSSS